MPTLLVDHDGDFWVLVIKLLGRFQKVSVAGFLPSDDHGAESAWTRLLLLKKLGLGVDCVTHQRIHVSISALDVLPLLPWQVVEHACRGSHRIHIGRLVLDQQLLLAFWELRLSRGGRNLGLKVILGYVEQV